MKSFKSILLLVVTNLLIFVSLSISFTILVNFILPIFGVDLRGSVSGRLPFVFYDNTEIV